MHRKKVTAVIYKVVPMPDNAGWTITLRGAGGGDTWIDVYPEDNVGVPRVGDIATVLVPVVVGIERVTP